MLYTDLYFLIYSYLNQRDKFKYGIVCKQFNKFLTEEIDDEIDSVNYEFDNICCEFAKMKKSKELLSMLSSHINEPEYQLLKQCTWIAIRTFDEWGDCETKIEIFDSYNTDTKILELNLDYDSLKDQNVVTTCMCGNIGFYEKYMGNRFEYYMNGKYIGINCLRTDQIKDYPMVAMIHRTINKFFVDDKIFPDLIELIKTTDAEAHAKIIRCNEFRKFYQLIQFLKFYKFDKN